jgi:L-amino acid N-acyltransferase YncA
VPIGQIRIDIKDDAGVLDYSVDKEFRGKGIGHLLLSKVNRNFINNHYPCSMLIGMVKQANVASIKSFLHAGFDIKTENDDIITFHVSRNSR